MKKIISILLMVTLTGCAHIKSSFHDIKYDVPSGYEVTLEDEEGITYKSSEDVLHIYRYNEGVVEELYSDGRPMTVNGINGYYSTEKLLGTELIEYHFYFVVDGRGYSVSSHNENAFREVLESLGR